MIENIQLIVLIRFDWPSLITLYGLAVSPYEYEATEKERLSILNCRSQNREVSDR